MDFVWSKIVVDYLSTLYEFEYLLFIVNIYSIIIYNILRVFATKLGNLKKKTNYKHFISMRFYIELLYKTCLNNCSAG